MPDKCLDCPVSSADMDGFIVSGPGGAPRSDSAGVSGSEGPFAKEAPQIGPVAIKGTLGADGNPGILPDVPQVGWAYVAEDAGEYGGVQATEGDVVYCMSLNPVKWGVLQADSDDSGRDLISVSAAFGCDPSPVLSLASTAASGEEAVQEVSMSCLSTDWKLTAAGSTTGRTLPERFADIVNVRDFGAKGDGVTDDTAAIRAAMAVAAVAGGSPYVHFPKGRYVFSLAENEQLSLLPFIGDSAVLLVNGEEHDLVAYRSGFLEYEKLDAFVVGFGYYRAWPDNGSDESNRPNFSECLICANGTSFHNIGNFDTVFKDGQNECRWGYVPEYYNGKLYLSWTYNGIGGYYITSDLKTFKAFEFTPPVPSPGDYIEPGEGKFVYLKNVNGVWYLVFYIFKDETVTSPTGTDKAVREYYYVTGNPDTNTWGSPTLFEAPTTFFDSCFDISFFSDGGVYYIVGQNMTTRKLRLLKSNSFTSGYSLVKEFDYPAFLESPTIAKYNGKYFLYALAYETGTLVCFVSDDMENWSEATGAYYDRMLSCGRVGGNLRFLSCFTADTAAKKKLIFDYMKFSGSSMSLGNDFIFKSTAGYGVAVPFSVPYIGTVPQNVEINGLTLTPNTIYVLDKNCEVAISGVDTSLMQRGDKCWFLVFHGAPSSRVVFKETAWSSTFRRPSNEGLSQSDGTVVIGALTNTAYTLVKCEVFFTSYLATCYLDIQLSQQFFRSDNEIIDLNDIKTTSFWSFTNAQAGSGLHFPYGEMGFLTVKNNSTAIFQEYVLRNSCIAYSRVYNPGVGWSNWVRQGQYAPATQTAAGLMSSADKKKIDTVLPSVPSAAGSYTLTATVSGGEVSYSWT